MALLPRVLTVDSTGMIARSVRAAIDLSGRAVIQTDVPSAAEALDEAARGSFQVVVAAGQLDGGLSGVELAAQLHNLQPGLAVLILGDEDERAAHTAHAVQAPLGAGFVYLRRPLDAQHFTRALLAGLDGASMTPAASAYAPAELEREIGPVPPIDTKVALRIVDSLLTDVGAMAVILASRTGQVLIERGAVGYLDREQLTGVLLPMVTTTIEMGKLVGGHASALQFYDGETYDIFVLSVGLHHFMCLVFDGQIGVRQFGAVNRFGRRAAEDLIALLGANAFIIEYITPPAPREGEAGVIADDEPLEPTAVRAEEWEQTEMPEPEPVRLEPIEALDLSLFDPNQLASLDENEAESLFDPDTLAEIANETRRDRGPLSYEEARQLGIVP